MNYSDKTFEIKDGAGFTAFFAESEPDSQGYVRGNIAAEMDGETVTAYEPASIHMDGLKTEIQGIQWPSEVVA